MKSMLCLLLWPFMTSIKPGIKPTLHHDRITSARQAIHKVRSLYEVKDFFAHTPKSSKPILFLDTKPHPGYKYYWIKMGISNFDMLRTSENFFVDQQTGKIFIWDQLDTADSYISIKQWRYWRGKPGFNQPHTYKSGRLVSVDTSLSKEK